MLYRKSFFVVLLAVLATACTHPHTDELEEARLAIKEAKNRGAQTYASKELESAEEAYQKAYDYVREQDYDKAYKHAKNSAELAYLARRIAEEREKLAKTGTEEKVALREDEAAQKPVGGEMTEEEGALSAGAAEILARPECKEIKIIYFDFDSFSLRPDASRAIQDNLPCLRLAEFAFSLEGHCDERGSNEYNLALGKRRSEAVKDYLIELGIKATRMETISYGEEKPAALGKNETAWAQNRRVEFVIK